ncbi:MAG: hypothetical protein WDM88_07045 [Galbitalea sp.]
MVVVVAAVAIVLRRGPRWLVVLLAAGILLLATAIFDNVMIRRWPGRIRPAAHRRRVRRRRAPRGLRLPGRGGRPAAEPVDPARARVRHRAETAKTRGRGG